jgi:hypothetical protein
METKRRCVVCVRLLPPGNPGEICYDCFELLQSDQLPLREDRCSLCQRPLPPGEAVRGYTADRRIVATGDCCRAQLRYPPLHPRDRTNGGEPDEEPE